MRRTIDRFVPATAAIFLAVAMLSGVVVASDPDGSGSAEFRLRLAEFTFDPLHEAPALPQGWDRSASSAPDLHLVQFDGRVPANAPELLRAAGLEPVQYIHPYTYIVWGRGSDRERLRGQSRVRWTGDFAPAFRVLPQWRDRQAESLDLHVLIFRGADVERVVGALSTMGTPIGDPLAISDKFEIAAFRIPGPMVRWAAAIPGVYSVQASTGDEWAPRAEVSAQINVGNVDFMNVAVPGYQAWLSGVGLDGTGVTVAIVDQGVDETHPDLTASWLPCTGASCTSAQSAHGTHVTGIVTGDGTSGVLDANGFLRGLGIAPGTRFFEQEYALFRYLPGGVSDLITDSRRNGATISNNSWGTSDVARGYDLNSLMVDAGVRDADPITPGNQSLLYVQAIANGYGGVSSQGAPDEAKNSLVVGSTWAIDQTTGNPNPNIDSLSDNTAHGPALDGRTIPHLVAPGCFVDSTLPNVGGGYEHGLRCGTSMAAPQVSGAAALFTEYYRGLPGSPGDPSPALVKAVFTAVARDLAGHPDADGVTMGHRPDSKQGWGRLDLRAVVSPPAGSVLYYDQARVFEESAESWLREIVPVNPAQPMRIMLAWTDAPGHGLGGTTPAWNNNLDLVVEAGGNTYRGNVFGSNGWSTTGGTADAMNNAEGVFFQVPPSTATVSVLATDINSDGVPHHGDDTDQDFALVCYNCAFAAGFDLNPSPVTNELCAPGPADYRIAVEQHGAYGDPVALSITGVPAGAVATFDVNPVAPGGQSLLSIAPGTVGDGNYTMQLDGNSPGLHRSNPLYMRLRTAVPAVAVLTAPANGAVSVSPQPVLQWDPVPWAASYVVQVSTDPTFQSIFYTGYSETNLHTVGEILAQGVQYYWRVRSRNVCGFGAFSQVSSFTTRNVPPVLLVDDDWDYWGDFQADYTSAMNALPLSPYFYPVTYDVWDVYAVKQQEEPDFSTLALYDKVIWWSGNEDFYAGPEYFSELELAKWFDRRGGCFLLSSSDYVFARGGVTDFMRQRLGVGSVVEDTGQGQVTGQGTVFNSLGTINLKNLNDDYSDSVSPDATAELAFSGDLGNAGVDKNGSFYRTTFEGFGLSRLFSRADREKTLLKFLQWCDGLPAVDGDGDGVANGVDCAPGDPGAWTVPSPVTDLKLSKGSTGFLWSQPVSGGGAVYDLLRSNNKTDFWNAACVASGVTQTSVPGAWDGNPLPGQIFFYLVRVHGACGTAPMGHRHDGTPRQGTACQ